MTNPFEIKVPDLGGATDVDVIELLVAPGDQVHIEDALITVEGDKASMDIPAPTAGIIKEVLVKVGDKVNEGDHIATLSTHNDEINSASSASDSTPNQEHEASTPEIASQDPASQSRPSDNTHTATNHSSTESSEPKNTGNSLVVIGSGPGGYTAAFRAADLGLNVTLVERYAELGGVCLNVGCIPSKALLHSADVITQAREMSAHGISFGEPDINIDKLREFKQSVISQLTNGLASMAKARKVNVIQGTAKFTSANTLSIEHDGVNSELNFDQAIIAAGSRVSVLPMFDIDDPRVMDSTGALELEDIPASMLIIGGGIIGLEMATVYSELGTEVTIVEYLPQLIPGADKDLVAPLSKRLAQTVKEIRTKTKVTQLNPKKNGIEVSFAAADDSSEYDSELFERVLIATGRRPNADRLNLENTGVKVDQHGFITVDQQMRTNVPHIFAIGDIVGQPMLAHKATHEAKVAAEVCAGLKSGFEASVIPSVAYTNPEVAWVGLTETQAKEQGIKYEKGVFPWAASGRAIGNARTEGKTKLLFDPNTHKLIGGGIVGTAAGDLIAEIAHAIEMGSEAQDIGLTIHPHPTLSETVAMAAEVYEGTITDLYIPKK